MKTCPFCAEEILEAAVRCKHCRSDLGAGGGGPGPAARALFAVGALALAALLLHPPRGTAEAFQPAELQPAAVPGQQGCPSGFAERVLPPGHPPVPGYRVAPEGAEYPPGHPSMETPSGFSGLGVDAPRDL